MRVVMTLPDGSAWLELETAEDAAEAQRRTRTAIGFFFDGEERLLNEAPGRTRISYFFLDVPGHDPSPVCLRVGERIAAETDPIPNPADGVTLVTGNANSNPYPRCGEAISALGVSMGRDLSGCYPYEGV